MSPNDQAPSGEMDRASEFVRLLSLHERSLNGFILALVPNSADADEIAQETKVRLWEQFDIFDLDKDFGAWARTVAHYQVLTFRKRSAREQARFSQQFLDLVAAEVEVVAGEVDGRHHALQECLAKLTTAARELVWRCYAQDESFQEIADSTGRTLAATHKAAVRARRSLHDCIERKMAGGDFR